MAKDLEVGELVGSTPRSVQDVVDLEWPVVRSRHDASTVARQGLSNLVPVGGGYALPTAFERSGLVNLGVSFLLHIEIEDGRAYAYLHDNDEAAVEAAAKVAAMILPGKVVADG